MVQCNQMYFWLIAVFDQAENGISRHNFCGWTFYFSEKKKKNVWTATSSQLVKQINSIKSKSSWMVRTPPNINTQAHISKVKERRKGEMVCCVCLIEPHREKERANRKKARQKKLKLNKSVGISKILQTSHTARTICKMHLHFH